MFLVELVQLFDDHPVALCDTEAEAIAVAEVTGPLLTPELCDVLGPTSDSIGVGIIEFSKGRPIKHRMYKLFEDAPATTAAGEGPAEPA